MTSFIFKQQ